MNRTQAELLLGACPPGRPPDQDQEMNQALALAAKDPDLARWLKETRAFDAAVARQLRSIPPPPDLRDAILASRAAAARGSAPRLWTRLPAVAAAVAALIGLALFWTSHQRAASAAGFRSAAATFLTDQWQHDFDFAEPSFPRIQDWVRHQSDRAVIDVPEGLAQLQTYGCKAFAWRGRSAYLVCFTPGPQGQVIHVVSVDRSSLPGIPASEIAGTPSYARVGEWNTARWTRGSRLYVALTTADPEALAQRLRPARL